uniref:Uncharacterized protein n=1 Tax=Octopus bimaculoides TaxID=37653 RepID=A0A0L8H557_OCTBM
MNMCLCMSTCIHVLDPDKPSNPCCMTEGLKHPFTESTNLTHPILNTILSPTLLHTNHWHHSLPSPRSLFLPPQYSLQCYCLHHHALTIYLSQPS